LLLPPLSVLAVEILNITNEVIPVILVLSLLAVTPLMLIAVFHQRWYGIGVWTLALAVLYHKSLWIYAGFSGSPAVVKTWTAKRWDPGVGQVTDVSTDILQNGILFPTYARLADIHVLTQMEVVNPFLVAFIPFALFVTFRNYTDSKKALLGATFFLFAHPFYLQYPTAGRAATPVLFLAIFGVVLSDSNLESTHASILSLMFLIGIITSHYGTSYFVMMALLGALMIIIVIRGIEDMIVNFAHSRLKSFDAVLSLYPDRNTRVLTVSLVLFHVVGALGWYMYAGGGEHFIFPKHLVESVSTLLSGELFGKTASRITRDHGTNTIAIRLSKFLYLFLAVLMGIGLLVVYLRRFQSDTGTMFDDRYLAVSIMMFVTFGSTFVVDSWGGGRPMMIIFVFTTIYTVVAVGWIINRLASVLKRFVSETGLSGLTLSSDGSVVFALFLAGLLLLNTGVASGTVLGGLAPSNVAASDNLEQSENPNFRTNIYRNYDIKTHAWMIDHVRSGTPILSGYIGVGQTDWYRPNIVSRSQRTSSYGNRGPMIIDRNEPIPDGYLLILGHNTALNTVWDIRRRPVALGNDGIQTDVYNRIYTNGKSEVMYRGG